MIDFNGNPYFVGFKPKFGDIVLKEDFEEMIAIKSISELKTVYLELNIDLEKAKQERECVDKNLKELNDKWEIVIKSLYLEEDIEKIVMFNSLKESLENQYAELVFIIDRDNQFSQITQNLIKKKEKVYEDLKSHNTSYKENDLSEYSLDDLLMEIKKRFENK